MKSNIIGLFLLVVVVALSAIYWKVDQDFFSEKLLWNEAQSRSELSALTRSVQSELEGFSQILDLTLPNLRELKKDYDHDQVYSHFHMIGTIVEQNGEVRFDQKYFLEGSPVKSWAPTYVPLALHGVHLGQGADSANLLLTILDPKRRAWVLYVATSRVTQKQYAAILSADALQGIIDRQKGQMSTLAILNSRAQVLGHTTSEYIGSLLKEDPLAQEFMKTGNGSGSGLFKSQGERIHGFFEQVEGTNLFVTVATPLRVLMADRGKIKSRFVFMGIGISLLGIAMLMLLGGGSTSHTAVAATSKIKTIAEKPKTVPMPQAAVPVVSDEETTKLPAPTIDSNEKFATLFSDKKINETFEMIDELESVPMPPPPEASVPELKLVVETEVPPELAASLPPPPAELIAVAVPASPAEPPPVGKVVHPEINIKIQRKSSKLDELDFDIRRPGKSASAPVTPSTGEIS